MFKTKAMLFTTILLTLITIPGISFGNSAEPPAILIIVPDAPDNLQMSIRSNNEYIEAKKIDKSIETYYAFYSHDLRNTKNYNVKIDSGEITFNILINESLKTYNNIFTLNLQNQTLTQGKALSRTITLVTIRIILTLIIEAIVFYLFGYRQKKSWIIFLITNLCTQGFLNIWLNGFAPLTSYLILSLIFAEILVFIVENFTFIIFVKEHSRVRAALYVALANLLSLISGGYIITTLPI